MCSYETIPEGRAYTLHFDSHFLSVYTRTAHVAFSLNFSFHTLSSYSLSYSVVLHICLYVSVHAPLFHLNFLCILPCLSSLFLLLSVYLTPSPVNVGFGQSHAAVLAPTPDEQQIWLPADKVVA